MRFLHKLVIDFLRGHAINFKRFQSLVIGAGAVTMVMSIPCCRLILIQLNFRKNGLIANAERIISAAIKGTDRQASKSRIRGRAAATNRSKNFIHGIAAQRDAAADGLAFAELKLAMLWRDLLTTALRP